MTGVLKFLKINMSDDDNDSDGSSNNGVIGTIFSILLLISIWPSLLVILGIFVAYQLGSILLTWITEHWLFTLEFLAGILVSYWIYRLHLIARVWDFFFGKIELAPTKKNLGNVSELTGRKFIPSTNLYCFQCIKKLGVQPFEICGKFYCKDCYVMIVGHK